MGDGKALQMGTSHEFGQNFAKVFGIDYLDDTGAQQTACTTSWGVSTRMVGGLIMGHGDDRGLRVPPRLAPIQVVVMAVRDDADVIARAAALAEELRAAGVRTHLDVKVEVSAGRRATDWELKGVPVRLELGPRDLAEQAVTVVDRIAGDKAAVPLAGVAAVVAERLDAAQAAMLAEATEQRDRHTVDVDTLEEAREASQSGWARVPWAAIGADGENDLASSSVTVRCLVRPDGTLPEAEDEPGLVAITGRSY
ncbi:MAG TPA: His/Gly/Thr/Pro-type tRNA ligase C-terminal domain-containing protein, partial [Acidimicrobiales bacterium]